MNEPKAKPAAKRVGRPPAAKSTTPIKKGSGKTVYDMLKNTDGKIFLYEYLKIVSKITNKEEQIDLLRRYAARGAEYTLLMRYFVECMFHHGIEFDLPLGIPEGFTPYPDAKDPTMAPATLFNEIKKIGYFINGAGNKIQNDRKRRIVFLQMMETMYSEEAKLLCMIKDRKLDRRVYPALTEKLFKETFPEWLPEKEVAAPNA